jgi:hypothetical protein
MKVTDGMLGELTQEKNQTELVGYGFPPLNDSDPTLPKCGEWPMCSRQGKPAAMSLTREGHGIDET